MAQAGDEGAAIGPVGVAVGVEGQDAFEDPLLDLAQSPAGSDVVGIDHRMGSERPVDDQAVSDQAGAQALDAIFSREAFSEVIEKRRIGHRSIPVSA